MKNYIAAFVVVLGMFYLVGSFASASFNIAEWNPFFRGWVGFVGLLMAFISVGITADSVNSKKK